MPELDIKRFGCLKLTLTILGISIGKFPDVVGIALAFNAVRTLVSVPCLLSLQHWTSSVSTMALAAIGSKRRSRKDVRDGACAIPKSIHVLFFYIWAPWTSRMREYFPRQEKPFPYLFKRKLFSLH